MRFRPALHAVFFLMLPQANAEELARPLVTLGGSLPWQYSSNPGRTHGSRHPDEMIAPYFKLSAIGELGAELSYVLYGSAAIDRYFNFADGNGSVAAVGSQIGKHWEHVQLDFTYERGFYFDEYFRRRESVANDLGVLVRLYYSNFDDGLTVRPSFSAVTRADDGGAVQRTLLTARVGIEKTITASWKALLTPQLRYYEYQDAQRGRRDEIFSIFGGVRYEISKQISWTSGIGYEARESNVRLRKYANYTIGTSIDFSFDLFRPAQGTAMPWEKR